MIKMKSVLIIIAVFSCVAADQASFEELYTQDPVMPPLVMPPPESTQGTVLAAPPKDPAPPKDEAPDDTADDHFVPEENGDIIKQVASLLGSDMVPNHAYSDTLLQGKPSKKRSKKLLDSINKRMGIKVPVSRVPSILKNSFEGHVDDAEDKAYNTHKKNSVGQNRIYGSSAGNSKIGRDGKVRPPGYTIEDAHFGPGGHFYIGASRRRIGGGFGRRRRSFKEREDKEMKRNYHKRLFKSIARRKSRSERHNKSCSFKICPKGTPGYKKMCTPEPSDCEKNLWCVKGRCKSSYGSSYSSSSTTSYGSSKITKRLVSVVNRAIRKTHKFTSKRMIKKAMKRTSRVIKGLKNGSLPPAFEKKVKAKKKLARIKAIKKKIALARAREMKLAKARLAKIKVMKAKEKRSKLKKCPGEGILCRAQRCGSKFRGQKACWRKLRNTFKEGFVPCSLQEVPRCYRVRGYLESIEPWLLCAHPEHREGK